MNPSKNKLVFYRGASARFIIDYVQDGSPFDISGYDVTMRIYAINAGEAYETIEMSQPEVNRIDHFFSVEAVKALKRNSRYEILFTLKSDPTTVIPVHRDSLTVSDVQEAGTVMSITEATVGGSVENIVNIAFGTMPLKGDKGDAATIQIGTVTTGDAGTQVQITNSGDGSDAVFNFVIPKGDKGDKGDQGEGLGTHEQTIANHDDVDLAGAKDGDFLIRDAGVWKSFNSLEARMRLGVEKGFVISVKTDNAGVSDDNQFQFTGALGDYTVEAYQNDSFVQRYTGLSEEQTITLPSAGTYLLRVLPEGATPFNRIQFNNGGDRLKMLDIRNWGDVVWSSFGSAFRGCANMIATYSDIPNLSDVASFALCFDATNFNGNVSDWDMSNIVSIAWMFRNTPFNGDVSNWDVSNVTNIRSTFFATPFNGDVSNWDVSNVTNMQDTFTGSNFSIENYNPLLEAWSQLTLQNDVLFNVGTAQYSAGAPATARQSIIDNFNWSITDGGQE